MTVSWLPRPLVPPARASPAVFAAGGTTHLILEVLAYAAEEVESTGSSGRCRVTLRADGSVSVEDNGRGTDTRCDVDGELVKKPIMATKDLRFFDFPDAQQLPDGHPRRGMSTVSALCPWLVHTNRRHNGTWTQRYEYGLPASGLLAIPDEDDTGTTVHFLPADGVRSMDEVSASASEAERVSSAQAERVSVVSGPPVDWGFFATIPRLQIVP